jgi:spore coat polysaccharide biosynthesis protein SpsF
MENPKIIITTQARLGSTRFPGKILEKIGKLTLLELHLKRIKKTKLFSDIIIATTNEQGIAAIEQIALNENIGIFKGSTEDVLDRFYQGVKNQRPDYIVRLTSDCPLIDPILIDEVIKLAVDHNLDYASNTLSELFPDGQDIEVFSWKALETAWKEATLPSEREHVTPYIRKHCDFNGGIIFKAMNYGFKENYSHIRMTVDELNDLDAIKILVDKLDTDNDWKTYADFIIDNPELFNNQQIIRNEGYLKSIKKENH